MAELEDVTLDGKPLHSLRVADLKAALEQRGLAKSGQKNALIKRLKGALMLENLQRTSTPHTGRQPNSQIGEEMSQNSFIKQYLAKQQELLLQRLEREAREASEADERRSPTGKVEDDHTSAKDGTSFMAEKHHIIHPHMSQAECGGPDRGGGLPQDPGLIGSHRLDTGHVPVSQESPDTKAGRIWHPSFLPSHEEVATPSPPRAVASLSVRVVGQPERQGLPLIMPRSQETEGTAPVEAGPAHSVLQLSRSARAAPHVQVDSDDDEDEENSGEDDDWGASSHGEKNVRSPALHPPPAAPQRSRRKLQLPQHIPPQPLPVQQPPLQIRQPTPPPSPPPELSFPLPDTPKQSPHDQDEPVNLGEGAARPEDTSPQPLKRQTSSSSSRSSSPEPLIARRPGPLSLLARKMESEGVFHGANKAGMERETKMEMEEPEVGEEGQSVQNVAHALFGSSVPTRSISQPTPQGSQARKERLAESSDEQKKGADTSASTLSSSLGFSLKRPQIFPHAKSPSKPEQLSVLTVLTGLKSFQDDAMEKKSTTISESKCDDKQIKFLEKPSLQSPEVAESDKTLKPLPTASEDKKIAQQQPTESSWSSSSDSDSESSSSYQSSSGSSQEKSRRKKGEKESGRPDAEEKRDKLSREVKQEALSEPAGQVAMELEGHSNVESVVQQSDQKGADLSDACTEENSSAKSIAARKISLSTGKAEISLPESESVGGGSRKRRWGSSTAVTAKKPSISITTESLKTLIPEIKSLQDAVVELHPDEAPLSSDDSVGLQTREEPEDDQGLKIRRTVTQVVQAEGHENGKKETEEEENESEESKCVEEEEDKHKITESISPDALMETEESVAKKVTPSDSLVRRSISQQKSGVSITIDDPIRTGRQPSPPRGKASNIIHVCNLVRPFTLGQLKELLSRTGTLVEEGFWIDKIKSHCYVTYSSVEEAQATREALHGIKWPSSNPKLLRVDFCEQDELDFHKGLVTGERPAETRDPQTPVAVTPAAPPPLLPPHREKERERDGATAVRDQWAERERAMERRERTRAEREWDRDKVKDFGREDRDRTRRSRSRDRRRRERGRSKENKVEKKEKPEEPPAKLLDDLFSKTKAAPCIYWLPLTEEQAAQRVLERAERIKEREKRRKELQEEEEKKREELREKAKIRDRESGNSGGNAGRRSLEGERGRERERERAREGERRREQRPSDSKPAGGARRSRSRSNAERRH